MNVQFPFPIEKCVACRGTAAEAAIEWNCIPVPSFGRPNNVNIKVATIGLNPALTELRLPKLSNFRKVSREKLTDSDFRKTTNFRENYFTDLRKNWHNYFEVLDSILGRINPFWSFGNCATHIDLIACATKKRFAETPKHEQKTLIANCHEHFLETISKLPNGTFLLLDGKTVCEEVFACGEVKFDSKREWLLLIDNEAYGLRGSIEIGGKRFKFRGWNVPAGKLHPIYRVELAIWLRKHCA